MHKSDMIALYDEFTIVYEQELSLDNAFVVDDCYLLQAVTTLSTHIFVTVLFDYYDEPGSTKKSEQLRKNSCNLIV